MASNGYGGVQGGVLFGYGPGTSGAGGTIGNYAYTQDLEQDRIAAQAKAQRDLAQFQYNLKGQDDAASRDFQGQQADANRQFQASQHAGDLTFQGQQGFDDRQLRRYLQDSSLSFQGNQAGLDRTFQGDQAQANRGFQASESSAQRAFAGAQADADRYFQGAQAGLSRDFTGGQNAADRSTQLSLANIGADTARRGQDVTSRGNDLQFQAAQLPFQFRQQLLDGNRGLIGAIQQATGGGADLSGYLRQIGGQAPQLPGLPPSEVFSNDLTQQKVNAARAQGDAAAGSQNRNLQTQLAAQGFGSRSPLQKSLAQSILTAASASNADQERGIRLDSAQANAQQGLQVGALANQQYSLFNDQDIRRRQQAVSLRNADLQGQLGLLGSIFGLG